jgi:hypothetical protein
MAIARVLHTPPIPLPRMGKGTSIQARYEKSDRCSRDSIGNVCRCWSGAEFCEFTMNGRYSRPFDLRCGSRAKS